MQQIKDIQTFYFIGIGGIGMSALARYFKLVGAAVYGYDKTPSEITEALITEGIPVGFVDSVTELPEPVFNREKTLVVYTPAIPSGNTILSYFRHEAYSLMKRAALLGEVTKDTHCLAVAGTHGKTTTSAILAHLLAACGMPVTAFLGGIAENYGSNFISTGTGITVVEADEFDRSFLQLRPDIACVTSMDADHLDIYGEASVLEEAFTAFSELVENRENLLVKKGLPLNGKTVAVGETADFEAQHVRIENGSYLFDLKIPGMTLKDLVFHLPGRHNLHNAIMAMGMALLCEAPPSGLVAALKDFKGVQRRFSYKIKNEQVVLIDDYAHHPAEITALFQAVEEMYPEDEKLIVFQPHLFSRTRDFANGFAESLSHFDEILLLDIYPAREEPIEGITSEWLLKKIGNPKKAIVSKNDLPEAVRRSRCRIKMLVGAGDIGAEVRNVTKFLEDEA